MSLLQTLVQVFWTLVSLLRFELWQSSLTLKANLEAASAEAKVYEEWLHYREELDALSGQSEWCRRLFLVEALHG